MVTVDPYAGLPPRVAAVRRYFAPTPARPAVTGPVIVWVLGLLLIVSGLASSDHAGVGAAVAGTVLGAIGGYQHFARYKGYRRLLAWAEPKPPDAWLDNWLYVEGRESVVRTARDRLHLVLADEAARHAGEGGVEPLVVFGLPLTTPRGFRMAFGRDGQLRSTHYDIIVFFLTKWHLCVYRALFEMESGFTLNDQTKEFAYRDVVSLATASDRMTMVKPMDHSAPVHSAPGGKPNIALPRAVHWTTQQSFRLRVASDQISTLVGIHFEDRLSTTDFGNGNDVERTIQLIRAKLREYTERREEFPHRDTFGQDL
jgi:hypothetical protein